MSERPVAASESDSVFDTARATRLRDVLDEREATAFVHAGTLADPTIRFVIGACSDPRVDRDSDGVDDTGTATSREVLASPSPYQAGAVYAVAFDGEQWWCVSTERRENGPHPSQQLAESLLEAGIDGTETTDTTSRLLTPAHIPHDAALYLERAGFELASSDVLSRLRIRKTEPELAAVERAQRAVRASLEWAVSLLERAEADTVGDGPSAEDTLTTDDSPSADDTPPTGDAPLTADTGEATLVLEDEPLTVGRLETVLQVGVLEAGGRPVSSSVVCSGANGGAERSDPTAALPVGQPLILTAEASDAGYHGRQTRTLVVDPDGGPERRAHIGLTHGFRSVASLLTAGEATVGTVEADIEAEIRAFGFDDAATIDVRVGGIGLERLERPLRAGTTIGSRSPVVVDASLETSVGRVRLADVLVRGDDGERARWLSPASRSLVPKNR